jgi:hypothetical protein
MKVLNPTPIETREVNVHDVSLGKDSSQELLPIRLRQDQYRYIEATETTSREYVEDAWRIHAIGYSTMGFVTQDAIDKDGFLVPDIDKSRRENTTYYIAVNPYNYEDRATLRLVNLKEGEDCKQLPAYELCKDQLIEESKNYLLELDHPTSRLKEISGLAKTEHSNPIAIYELLRKIIRDALGKNEIWFFSGVSSTVILLAKNLGERNIQIIGDDISIDDDRVNPTLRLRPAIFQPDLFYENLFDEFKNASNPARKAKLKRSIIFYADGLGEDELGLENLIVRNNLLRI